MINNIKDEGYTVKELMAELSQAIEAGMGDRRIYIGPVGGEEGNEYQALPVVGVEGTTDENSSELDIFWLYPGDNEW